MEHEKAFCDLIDNYKRLIYKVCYMYSKNHDESKDYFQEVTLNLWKAFPSFRGECSPETWIYRIALNTCITQLRKSKLKPDCIPLNADLQLFYDNEADSRLAELNKMIQKLNPVDKAIVLLYLEEKSYDDIASLVGISKSNVGVRLTRIKEKLRSMSNE